MIVMDCPPLSIFICVSSQICHLIQETIRFAYCNIGMNAFGQAFLENVLDDLKELFEMEQGCECHQ